MLQFCDDSAIVNMGGIKGGDARAKQAQTVDEHEKSCLNTCITIAKKRVPIIEWLPKYSVSKGLQDALAGVTVGLTEIPQGIAYAVVAGLEPQYGLYSGFMGCFMYGIFGSCKDINIGPTAIMALMTQPHVEKLGPDMAVLLTFLTGLIIFILGFLRLGFLVEFISYPVTVGFTAAAALQIASSQLKGLLGQPGKANEFLEAWMSVIDHIKETTFWDPVLGVSTIVVLVIMREFKRFGGLKYNPNWSRKRNYVGRLMWSLSLGRNVLAVVFGTILAYVLMENGLQPFKVTGKVVEGLPPFQLPPFSTTFKNETYEFGDMMKQFGETVIFAPLIAILESIAIAKAFAKGKTIDVTQELIALGLSNFMGSFVKSIPVTGSFTRTAVNNASGVQTPLAGILTGGLVLLSLSLLTSTFYYIPKTTLAAVVISSMFYLIDVKAVWMLWKTKKLDLIPLFATFFTCLLLSLEYGILVGVAANLLFILYPSARPPIDIEETKVNQGDVFVVTPERSLHFPAAEYMREKVMRKCHKENMAVVINGKYVNGIDATVAKNFKVLANDLVLRGQRIVFWKFKESVIKICEGTDKNLRNYFKDGPLEDIIQEPQQERVGPEMVFTVQ